MLQPLRPSAQVVVSMPGFQCYCCHDTGLIIRQDAFYQDSTPSDVAAMCRRCGSAVSKFGETTKYLDGRVTREQCDALHRIRYEDWLETIRKEGSGLKSANPEPVDFGAIAKPMPKQPELNPAPEKPITELDGFKIGDKVRITLKRFSAAERKEIARNEEVPVGSVGEIVGFEKSRVDGGPVAVVQFDESQRRMSSIWFEALQEVAA